MPPEFTFPSPKNVDKYPLIAIKGNPNDYVEWIRAHPEIDMRVPPVFQNFRLIFNSYDIVYDLFVHYSDDFTSFEVRWKMDDRTIGIVSCDYAERREDGKFHYRARITENAADKYKHEWLENAIIAVGTTVIATQAYMLYHKPEIVEQVYAPSSAPEKSSSAPKKRVNAEPVKIRKSKIKRITLSEDDRPPKEANYRKLSWHVRGHYRHMGKSKKLVYIQPYTCNRGGKKYKANAKKYEIEE